MKGFSLVEILIAIGLSMLFFPAVIALFSFSHRAARQGESYTKAYTIATKAIEEVTAQKSTWDFTVSHEGTTVTTEGPSGTNGIVYTRTTTLSKAHRSGNMIDDTGMLIDDNTYKVDVLVTWPTDGQVHLTTYVAKH